MIHARIYLGKYLRISDNKRCDYLIRNRTSFIRFNLGDKNISEGKGAS